MTQGMNLGFTGSQHGMTPEQLHTVKDYLRFATRLHNGYCVGADEECLQAYDEEARVRKLLGNDHLPCLIIAHLPIKVQKMTRFQPKYAEVRMRQPKDFLDRDEDIAIECEKLIATPQKGTEQMRSGTWATIRRARKWRRAHDIILPSGLVSANCYTSEGKLLTFTSTVAFLEGMT